MSSPKPSASNTTAGSKAVWDVQSKWDSVDVKLVNEWLAPQHSQGPRSDGRAIYVVSVSLERAPHPKHPQTFGLNLRTQSRFCGDANGCSLEEEPALGSFPVLADICRGLQEDLDVDYEAYKEKTADHRDHERVDGTDGGKGSDTAAQSVGSRPPLLEWLTQMFASRAVKRLKATPSGKETYSKAVDLGDAASMAELVSVSSCALAEGVSYLYHGWLGQEGYDLTDESRLVRIGAVSEAEMQQLWASTSREPWSFSTLVAKPLPAIEVGPASAEDSDSHLASPPSQTSNDDGTSGTGTSVPSRRRSRNGKYWKKRKPPRVPRTKWSSVREQDGTLVTRGI